MRKLYNMPPTDPRFLALTNEQIELEWAHCVIDNPKLDKNSESYVDDNYEAWEKEAVEEDRKITYVNKEKVVRVPDGYEEADDVTHKTGDILANIDRDPTDWETVEIDSE